MSHSLIFTLYDTTHGTYIITAMDCDGIMLTVFLSRRGHHNRALEDAVSSQKAEWPGAWNGVNPISGTKSFNTMTPSERVITLLPLTWMLR